MDESGDFFEAVGTATDDAAMIHDMANRHRANAASAPATPVQTAQVSADPIRAWSVANGHLYRGISQSIDRLPPGCYAPDMTDQGVILNKHAIFTDALIDLPDSKSRAILAEIKHFQTLRSAFAERQLLFKRGVLIWGPPGSGKTSTLHLMMQMIIDAGGLALFIGHPEVAIRGLQLIREIEPTRQIIGVLEDLDGLIGHYGVEQYLSLLDGEAQVDNVIFVATTNYPERLDRRFVDRPSRFDTVEFVGMPSDEARRAYLRYKEPTLPDAVIDNMVAVSDGMSIAHLRELIILTQCFKHPIDKAAKRLNQFRHRRPSSDRSPDAPATGFTIGQPIPGAVLNGHFTFPNWNHRNYKERK